MLMEYYNFTQDKTFLREVAYPAVRILSQFYAKALSETDDGRLLVEDSASPEIRHPFPGGDHYKTIGCTYDQSLVWQNHTDLLRALPKAWHSGHFDGLVARGNFKVSAQWEKGILTGLEVHSRSGRHCALQLPDITNLRVLDESGRRIDFTITDANRIHFPTTEGTTYTLQL